MPKLKPLNFPKPIRQREEKALRELLPSPRPLKKMSWVLRRRKAPLLLHIPYLEQGKLFF